MIVVALIAGAFGLVVSWALRRPTTLAKKLRASQGVADERMILLSLPGVSLILLGAGLAGLIAPGIGGFLGTVLGVALIIPCLAMIILGVYLSVLGLGKSRIPDWLLPRK